MRRGIVGGTFDPPHLAHLVVGETAYRQMGLDVVTFIPAGAPWQKLARSVSDADDRWNMTLCAVDGVDYFVADDREVRRDGWSYTIDTLEELPGDDLVLILGADAASRLATWERAKDVLEAATIAVVPRPGTEKRLVEDSLSDADLVWLDAPLLDISGSELRRRARAGASVRFLVREAVWRYIEEHRIYD
ncbi:MAG TPA: nicotinate (nicotinamide) nucleotide adenylyltransferase [Actinobacteria bacterium]|nr:nicotinate (nicotinamide) nucleotide adenylyltransferase [Actinomycetota bacterium]